MTIDALLQAVEAGSSVPGFLAPRQGRGFMRDAGVFTAIEAPGFDGTQAVGINNRSQIVGYAHDLDGAAHGFVFDNGAFTLVEAPDARLTTRLFEINDEGRLAGAYGITGATYERV